MVSDDMYLDIKGYVDVDGWPAMELRIEKLKKSKISKRMRSSRSEMRGIKNGGVPPAWQLD